MKESEKNVPAVGSLLKRIRRFIAVVCSVLTCALVFLYISETKNEITVINETSIPANFELESVKQFRTPDDQLPSFTPVFSDQTIAPHSKIACTFRLPEKTALVLADVRTTSRGRLKRYRKLPAWGNRITIVEGESRTSTCELTVLRQWFDTNRNWLDTYRHWIPLSKSWWD